MYGYTTFHDNLMKTLINSVRADTASHAYIFEGERGLFKRESASLFAAALTCKSASTAPCNSCEACLQAKSRTNPDIIYVERPADKKTIGVEAIRALNDDVAIRPFYSRKKVYIINDGDSLTVEAQNAFLKTLEEPPKYAVFIIVSENSAALLPTVLSRAEKIHFAPVSDKLIEEYIRSKYPEQSERIPFLAKYCGGIPKNADDIIADNGFETLRASSLESLTPLLSKNTLAAYDIQKFLSDNKDDAEKILDFWISYLRDITVIQCGAPNRVINADKSDELQRIAGKYDPKRVTAAVGELTEMKKMLARFVNLKAASLRTALRIKANNSI